MRTTATSSFPYPIRLLLVNQLGVNTGFYLLIPYLAWQLGEGLGMSAAVVGIVLGARNLSQQGLFLLGGSAADRLGPRRVIIAGCALRTLGFGLFALGDGLPVLLAASVLSGLAGALFNPAVRAYLAQEAGDRKAEAFALFNVFATAGTLLGPLLGSALLLVGFTACALVAAGIFAVLTVAQALVLPDRPVPPATRGLLGDWREVLRDRRFLAFSLATSGMFTLESQVYLLLPEAARAATGREIAVGAVFLTGTVAGLALQIPLTRAIARRGARGPWIAAGLALMGVAFLLPLAPGLPPVLAAALLLQLGVMAAQPLVMELVPAFGGGLTGTRFGVHYGICGLIAAAGNAGLGWALDTGDRLPWLCATALGLACAAAVLRLHRSGRLPAPGGPPAPEPVAGPPPAAGRRT
ncbi:MFS transporter [Streptomyces litchfieldiae]|uniref:MFS transporter n=1 Tax=Streptomyces litchfieldiae TaxID=3075543 RepID=A0ABU2MX88_9ACTN|nr:MFS transporter [Streptomyces sp. DSM 44938]MDT0346265.1 MFS transporter [Streptomyces sp. DSM 44938]